MGDESFYGETLSGKSSEVQFEVVANEEYPVNQKLTIKQILLGSEAAANEVNEVEAQLVKTKQKIPIAVLKAGETRALTPNIEFFDSVTFKLTKGAGPVYIHGTLVKDIVEVVDWEGDETDDDDGGEEEEEGPPRTKQKLDNNADGKNAKHKKK